MVNSMWSQRLFYIRRESPLKDQLLTLMKDKDKEGKEDPKLPNDLCDSMLYNARECRNWLSREPAIEPEVGSEEYYKAEQKKMFEIVKKRNKGRERQNNNIDFIH
jgi:hypothetical protein